MKPSFPFEIQTLYEQFDKPVTETDCGKKCAPQNPNGVPFCCDQTFAVPAVYLKEWQYLKEKTTMWHLIEDSEASEGDVHEEVPDHMCLIACKGAAFCDRHFRAISCRQFPFYPYITSDLVFLGLSYEFKYEQVCWVLKHLDRVRAAYREAFIRLYDMLFEQNMRDLYSYYLLSESSRETAYEQDRRIPLLHRNGSFALIDPESEEVSFVPST
jgi:hypothetical protein